MHIYFSGIGGAGLYPLALLARDIGFEVSGSDVVGSENTRHLSELGIRITLEQSKESIAAVHKEHPIDWLVASSAIKSDSPELVFADSRGIRVSKRNEFISNMCEEQNLDMLAVSGTHGKTSTTALLVWALEQLKVPASHIVGGGLSFAPAGRYQSGSNWFVYEADEYDRNFLAFHPKASLITSLDYDHPDTYADEAEYIDAFKQFINQSEQVITWPEVQDSIGDSVLKNTTIIERSEPKLQLPGEHNRRNASLCLKVLERITEQDSSRVIEALNSFPGVGRRMERLAPNVYSDYAHHPVEIAATIQLAKELNSRVTVVYQPHQNLRQHQVKDQYARAFEDASKVYWLPTFLSREDPDLEVLTPEQLVSYVESDTEVEVADLDDELVSAINEHASNGDTVLCMGAGSIDEWARNQFSS